MEYPHIKESRQFSNARIEAIRSDLQQVLGDSPNRHKITIVTTGSYGRKEASEESDIDYYVLLNSDIPAEDLIPVELASITDIINRHVPAETGDTGTFGSNAVQRFADMLTNIGGTDDSNVALTRRMLFLLEGDYLYNEDAFRQYQNRLLEKYIPVDARIDRVPLFLLNDIIRYYRTITTDLEHKVREECKPWGLRSVKLRFSRKLLYFGGIVVAAELVDKPFEARMALARKLFSMPVLDRLNHCEAEEAGIRSTYDAFLALISRKQVREELDALERSARNDSPLYCELRDLSDRFSRALLGWLQARYPASHSIHAALLL